MKKYFSSLTPVSVDSKVTFLRPDNSPLKVIKSIPCRNYSFNSKYVMRGTVKAVSKDRRHIKVEHYSPEQEKVVMTKVPMVQAFNSENVYVNERLLTSAKEYGKHLGMYACMYVILHVCTNLIFNILRV